MNDYTYPELVARAFHEAYERLAPSFGYETRTESAVPWEQVPNNNRALMTAVAAVVIPRIAARALRSAADALEDEAARLRRGFRSGTVGIEYIQGIEEAAERVCKRATDPGVS